MNRLSPIQTHFHISSLNLPTRVPLPPFAARFPFSARGEGRFISEDETFNLKFPRRGDILNRFPSLSLENFINRNEMRGGGGEVRFVGWMEICLDNSNEKLIMDLQGHRRRSGTGCCCGCRRRFRRDRRRSENASADRLAETAAGDAGAGGRGRRHYENERWKGVGTWSKAVRARWSSR